MKRHSLPNRHFTLPAWTFLLLVCWLTPASAQVHSGDLTVLVSGLAPGQGFAIANLFRPGQDVLRLKQAFHRQRLPIQTSQVKFVFQNLAYGNYALSVFQDLNRNGELDHFSGFPAEPLGFSNGFKLSVLNGLPSFDKLQFSFSGNHRLIQIELGH